MCACACAVLCLSSSERRARTFCVFRQPGPRVLVLWCRTLRKWQLYALSVNALNTKLFRPTFADDRKKSRCTEATSNCGRLPLQWPGRVPVRLVACHTWCAARTRSIYTAFRRHVLMSLLTMRRLCVDTIAFSHQSRRRRSVRSFKHIHRTRAQKSIYANACTQHDMIRATRGISM